MLLIECPWCGAREGTEFHYGGQAHLAYPDDPAQVTDAEWAQVLYFRDNPRGLFAERWMHRAGCRQWFNVVRDTVTNAIIAVYRIGEWRPPAVPAHRPATGQLSETAGR